MKKMLLAALAFVAMPAFSADVGVSISIGQPGFYGRIDIGDFPPPMLIYREPIIVHRAPYAFVHEPIYLRVPPGHAKRWSRYCGRYDACGRPVYFVQDRWYNNVYVPEYRKRHHHGDWKRHDRGPRAHRGRDDWRDDRRSDRRRDRRDDRRDWDRNHRNSYGDRYRN